MRNINRQTILILQICLCFQVLASCEEMIEVDTPSNQIVRAQIFEDVQTANSALSGLYASLRDQSVIAGNNYGAGAILGSYVDDLDCYYNDSNEYQDIYLNSQHSTNNLIERTWNLSYQQIYFCNSIIYGVENSISLTTEQIAPIKAEALFVRSLLYYYLQQLYGDIPYTTSTDYEYNKDLNKLSEEQLLNQLESDLHEVVLLMEDSYREPQRIYPNRKAAELLLSQIYLSQNKWYEAEILGKSILQSNLYQLVSDVSQVFQNSGPHILWQLKPQNYGDSTHEASFYYFIDSAPHAYALSQDLINSFSPNDLRMQDWITSNSIGSNTWYRPTKYKNLSGTNTDEYSIVYRIEEVYFTIAEALLKQNKSSEALGYLNAIRERAGLAPLASSLSNEELVTEYLSEKRREYFAEFGKRFFDLKRLGKLGDLSSKKPNWQEYHNLWPLPQRELLLNQHLNPQNQGY